MKKYLLLLPAAVFPYGILLAIGCLYNNALMARLFGGRVFPLFQCLLGLWLIGLICTVLFLVFAITGSWDGAAIAKANMVIKLGQVPAYVLIFLLGTAYLLTIFTAAISVILLILDTMAILLSGLVGLTAVLRGRKALGGKGAVLHGILQFVFCADVVSAVLVYRRLRAAGPPQKANQHL